MAIAYLVVLGLTVGAVLLGWAYLRRFPVTRPPLGVINLGDVAFMIGGIVLIPYLYLGLPIWLVGAILGLGMLAILYFVAEPVLRSPVLIWPVVGGLIGADVALALWQGTTSRAYFVVNDLVLLLVVVGISNLWAQSGLRARDLAVLAAALIVYDAVATAWLPLTSNLIDRLSGLPFTPMVVWRVEADRWLGIGLGDLLLATVGPLVLRKAYGRPAGLGAIAIALGTVAGLLALAASGRLEGGFPVMVVLGPLLVGQYAYWVRRRGGERTTGQYLRAEPLPSVPLATVADRRARVLCRKRTKSISGAT
ncbi:MAG: hypothetical protein ACRDJH_21700 [Thermomicrobiales bacterium]